MASIGEFESASQLIEKYIWFFSGSKPTHKMKLRDYTPNQWKTEKVECLNGMNAKNSTMF